MSTATRTSDFNNSLGVNTHLGFGGPYANPSQVITDLNYLGIHNVRDAADYGTGPLTTLGQAGVKVDLLTSQGVSVSSEATPLAPYLSSIEGPNEVNLNNIGPSQAQADQQGIWNLIHSTPALSGVSSVVYSVSSGSQSGFTPYGNNDAWTNFGNAHIYFGGGSQPAGPLAQFGYAINTLTPGQTEYITETGYTSATVQGGGNQAVNQDVQAKQTLNLFMDAYKQGYGRTFLYELYNEANDGQQESSYGLYNNDGTTPKPVGTAIHNLTTVLSDTGSTANTFIPDSLNYSVTGLPSSGNSQLFEKSDGTFDLAVWAEPQIWNQNTMQESQAPVSNVTVNLGSTFTNVQVIDPMQGSTPVQTLSNVSTVNLAITDHPLLVQIAPGSSPPPPPPPPPGTSPDNTVILASQSGASITDSNGKVWTINNGVVQENGQNAGFSSSVKELAWENGVIWQENTNNLWWSWNNSTNSWDGGSGSSTSPVPSSPPPPPPPSGVDDTLVLDLSGSSYNGNPIAQLTVDGKNFGSPITVTASHAASQIQETNISLASVSAGKHTIGVLFTNDLYGGSPTADRNLWVSPIKVGQLSGSTVINPTTYGSGIQELYSTGDTRSFANVLIAH